MRRLLPLRSRTTLVDAASRAAFAAAWRGSGAPRAGGASSESGRWRRTWRGLVHPVVAQVNIMAVVPSCFETSGAAAVPSYTFRSALSRDSVGRRPGRGRYGRLIEELPMEALAKGASRRSGVTAVHSLNRFVLTVPALDEAERFYTEFGLDVRRSNGRVDLYTFGHPHCWGTIHEAPGRKKLQYLSFGVYEQDLEPLLQELDRMQIARVPAHPLSDNTGVWLRDPDSNLVQIVAADKVSPDGPALQAAPPPPPAGRGAAPSRSAAGRVRPRCLSHALLFSSDVPRSVRFYGEALGLRLSDHCGELIAFMHGAHASDHHMLAFVKSDGPGYHRSSLHVASIDDVGIGRGHMVRRGFG